MNALVATVVGASLWLGAEVPSGAPLTSPPALFERAEPHVEDGAAHLADGEPDLAIESFRQATPTSSDERAVIEYDVGTALLARALLKAAAAPPRGQPPQGQPPQSQPAAPAPTPDPNHPPSPEAGPQPDSADLDDARAAFERAYGLARDARLKSEAALAAGNVAAQANDVDEAIAQYRKALVAFPKNERAKKNLRRVLEAKRAQPPPPPQQGDGEDDEKDDEKDGDEQQQQNEEQKKGEQKKGEKKGEDEKGEDEKGEDEKGEDEKDQKGEKEQKDQEQKDSDKNKEPAPQDAAQKAKKQKKDEARRLLDALRARERPLTPLEMRGQKRRQQPKGGKDW